MKLKKRTNNGIYMLTHQGRRISTGERTLAKAEIAAREIINNNGARPSNHLSKRTLGEALEDVYKRIWSQQKSERAARYRMLQLQAEVGDVDVAAISYNWLVAYVEKLRDQGKQHSTINRKLSAIRLALRESNKLGFIASLPPFPFQKEQRTKIRWLSADEQLLMTRSAFDLWTREHAMFMEAMINVLVYTGARFNEFYTSCVDETFDSERIYFIDTKNGTNRSLPLPPQVLPPMRVASEFLKDNHRNLHYQGIHLRFKKLVDHCGLKNVTMHTLRHTCASRLVSGGVSLYKVKNWLGHKSVTTTEIYAHLAPESLDTDVAHVLPPVH